MLDHINRAPKAAELQAGVEPMRRLIGLMPRLKVVLLQGRHAENGWHRLEKKYPGVVDERGLTVIWTYHPGQQALWSPDALIRQARIHHREAAYEAVAAVLAAHRDGPSQRSDSMGCRPAHLGH